MEGCDAKDGRYEMFVYSIEKKVAYCSVVDEGGGRSELEVPVGDLEEVVGVGEVVPGLIMDMFYCQGDFGFGRAERSNITQEELKEMLVKYEELYRDV